MSNRPRLAQGEWGQLGRGPCRVHLGMTPQHCKLKLCKETHHAVRNHENHEDSRLLAGHDEKFEP